MSLFWQLAHKHRKQVGSVLDLGAGDCRFTRHGHFREYVGVEIDSTRSPKTPLPQNARLIHNCAFRHRAKNYDVCVGNPPYVRHHDIENGWKEETVARINRDLGISLNRHCNLYLYFFSLALLKTHEKGLLALLIPYEWVSRPSAKAIRDLIRQRGWNVSVYRFQSPLFPDVLTTASVSIVDKAKRDGQWTYFDISPTHRVVRRGGMADSKQGVLEYANRGEAWGLRGLSPGSQKVFTLTEGERIHFGLGKRDVVPCVTTLKHVPRNLKVLSRTSFTKYFVDAGARCWLIRSYKQTRSDALNAYLESVPLAKRDNYTCRNQTPWFNFSPHPVPQLLFGSGFVRFGPKVLINHAHVRAVGSVWGIHAKRKLPAGQLQTYLRGMNFERRVVPHARTLKKVEVKQLNGVLNAFTATTHPNGRTPR